MSQEKRPSGRTPKVVSIRRRSEVSSATKTPQPSKLLSGRKLHRQMAEDFVRALNWAVLSGREPNV